MAKLLVLQSLWTFENLRHLLPGAETLEGQLDLVAAAGFAGIGTLWLDRAEARRVASAAKARGLVVEGLCVPQTVEDLKPALDWAGEFGIHHLNLQPDVRPLEVRDCLPILEGWQRLAADSGIMVNIETHRGRMTNDLLFTCRLLDAMPDLALTADLSHYVVGREIMLPVAAETEAQIGRILDHARGYHGRVASSNQIQLELAWARNRPWIDQFSHWWGEGFRRFRAKAGADAELTFLCELGAAPYASSDEQGRDLGDRWADSFVLRDLARTVWAQSAFTPS